MREKSLNEIMELEHVIRVNPDLTITESVPNVHAPECVIEVNDDGQIMPADEKAWLDSLTGQGWEALDGYSGQSGYTGPIMHASEYIGGHMENAIRDQPGLYVACTVECLAPSEKDDPEEPAGWVVLRQDIELPHVAYVCPCCGVSVMDTQPICDDCTLADCARTGNGNDRGYSNCERTDLDEYHLQFCDREANQDITGDPAASQNATEVRLWVGTDGTLGCAVEKNARSGMWHVSGSDVTPNWTSRTRPAYRSWDAAMVLSGMVTREQIEEAN